MTRGQVINKALKITDAIGLVNNARDWLDKILLELPKLAYWKFLQETVSYTSGMMESSVALANAGITNYHKKLMISSTSIGSVERVSKNALEAMNDGVIDSPKYFALWDDSIYWYPYISIQTTFTLRYYKQITLPTADSDDLETVCNIPLHWHKFIIDGLIAEIMRFTGDKRQEKMRQFYKSRIQIMKQDNDDYVTYQEGLLSRYIIAKRIEKMLKDRLIQSRR